MAGRGELVVRRGEKGRRALTSTCKNLLNFRNTLNSFNKKGTKRRKEVLIL